MTFFDLLGHEPLGLRRETLRVRVPRQTQMGQNLQRQWVETGNSSGRVSACLSPWNRSGHGNQGWHFLNWGNSRSFVVGNPISIPNQFKKCQPWLPKSVSQTGWFLPDAGWVSFVVNPISIPNPGVTHHLGWWQGQLSRPGVYPVLCWSDCWDAKAFQVNSVGWFVGTFLV